MLASPGGSGKWTYINGALFGLWCSGWGWGEGCGIQLATWFQEVPPEFTIASVPSFVV